MGETYGDFASQPKISPGLESYGCRPTRTLHFCNTLPIPFPKGMCNQGLSLGNELRRCMSC